MWRKQYCKIIDIGCLAVFLKVIALRVRNYHVYIISYIVNIFTKHFNILDKFKKTNFWLNIQFWNDIGFLKVYFE